jgi:hypothetical protein
MTSSRINCHEYATRGRRIMRERADVAKPIVAFHWATNIPEVAGEARRGSGVSRNFVRGGPTKSVEDRGHRQRGSGGR